MRRRGRGPTEADGALGAGAGTLEIEIDGREPAVLNVHEGIMVPKGVRHRPKAPKGAVVLMVEQNTIVPTGG
jgi:hypothetical protein